MLLRIPSIESGELASACVSKWFVAEVKITSFTCRGTHMKLLAGVLELAHHQSPALRVFTVLHPFSNSPRGPLNGSGEALTQGGLMEDGPTSFRDFQTNSYGTRNTVGKSESQSP